LHVILSYLSAEHIGVLYPGLTFLLLGKYCGHIPSLPGNGSQGISTVVKVSISLPSGKRVLSTFQSSAGQSVIPFRLAALGLTVPTVTVI